MPRKFLRRHLPTPSALRAHRALRPVGRWLQDPELWHLHRRSVSGAAFIGLFVAFIPIPFQMLVAAVLAVIARCNLPLSVALVWITNPVTMPPVFYFAYQLGAWLLDRRVEVGTIELNWSWLSAHLGDIGWPLLFGSLVCGWVAGVTAMVLVRVLWRLHVIRRWRARRLSRRTAPAEPPPDNVTSLDSARRRDASNL
ncbi:MAG TPA: DUF2062 domain-containing protein [Pseudomonadales bacterium]